MEDVADSDMAEVVRGAVLRPCPFTNHITENHSLQFTTGCIMAPYVLR